MKKVILLSAFFSLLFVNCTEDEGDIDNYGPNTTIVGFAESFTSNFGTNMDSSTLNIPVNLVSYANETYPEDVTVQFSVDPSSTAVAGVDYDLPSASSVVLPSGSTVATIPFTVHPSVFDPADPKTLVLNLTTVTSNNAVIGAQYDQITVTLQGVCVSELEGEYSTTTVRLDNNVEYYHEYEFIELMEGSTYTTQYLGAYHGTGSTPGTSSNGLGTAALAPPTAPLFFTEVCGKLKVDTQNLANYYSNEVRQSAAQYELSNVNDETGVITIHYSIFFTNNTIERPFMSTYTPLN